MIHDAETRMGWGAVWCTCCGRGLNLSRVRVPEWFPARSAEVAERDGPGFPDFVPIDAEVQC